MSVYEMSFLVKSLKRRNFSVFVNHRECTDLRALLFSSLSLSSLCSGLFSIFRFYFSFHFILEIPVFDPSAYLLIVLSSHLLYA